MIEEPPLLTIRRNFPRPSADEVAAFRGALTGHIVDALGGRAALDGSIKPIAGSPPFCGVALTCTSGPADNVGAFGALHVAQPGDVIVSANDGFRETAVSGDILLGMMKNAKLTAFVTDGFVRDVAGIRAVGFPCYAAGITPNSPHRTGPGTVGFPIVVGGAAVSPGDILVGDEDGVVVVPREKIAEVIARLAGIRKAEAAAEAEVRNGSVQPQFVRRLIEAGRFTFVD